MIQPLEAATANTTYSSVKTENNAYICITFKPFSFHVVFIHIFNKKILLPHSYCVERAVKKDVHFDFQIFTFDEAISCCDETVGCQDCWRFSFLSFYERCSIIV